MVSRQSFILGFPYSQKRSTKCCLMNFIVGQAKLAIYLSRKNKVNQTPGYDVVAILRNLLMSRVSLEFCFYKTMGSLDVFAELWCCEDAICSVFGTDLVFSF